MGGGPKAVALNYLIPGVVPLSHDFSCWIERLGVEIFCRVLLSCLV